MDAGLPGMEMTVEQVRGRLRDAVRRGNPRWLWPEVDQERWRASLVMIERVTRDVLLEGRSSVRLSGDAVAFGVAAFTGGMGPLLGQWLEQKRFVADGTTSRVLACHLAHNTARMAKMRPYAIEIVEALSNNGVAVMVLKGMHTAFAHFADPGTRPMSDIDLLVSPEQEGAAAQVLAEHGYRPSGTSVFPERTWRKPGMQADPRNVFFVHADDQWSIDLHVTLDLRATSAAPIRLDPLRTDSLEAWPLSSAGHCLASPLLLLHLAVHAGAHLLSLTMIRLTELVLVIRADEAAGRLSWDDFLALAQRTGVAGNAYPALRLSNDLAPGTVPPEVLLVCRGQLPGKALRVLDSLQPASACPITRCSIGERTMWTQGVAALARQIAGDVIPYRRPRDLLGFYRVVLWRLLRRTVTW